MEHALCKMRGQRHGFRMGFKSKVEPSSSSHDQHRKTRAKMTNEGTESQQQQVGDETQTITLPAGVD